MLTTPAPNASPSAAAGTPPSSIPRFLPFYSGLGTAPSVPLKSGATNLQQSQQQQQQQQNSHAVQLGHNCNSNIITNHSHNNTGNNNLGTNNHNNNINPSNINSTNPNNNLSQQRSAAGTSGLPTLRTADIVAEGGKCLTHTSNNNQPPSFEHLPLTNSRCDDTGNNKSSTTGGGGGDDSSPASLAKRIGKDKGTRPTANNDSDLHSVTTTNTNINNNRHKSFGGADLAANTLIPQTPVQASINSSNNKVLLSTLRTKSLPSCNLIGPSRLATPSNWKEGSAGLYQSQPRQQSPALSITHLPRPSTYSAGGGGAPFHLKTNSTHQLNGSNAADNALGLLSAYASPSVTSASKLRLVKTQSLGFNEAQHRPQHSTQHPNNNNSNNNIGNLLNTLNGKWQYF